MDILIQHIIYIKMRYYDLMVDIYEDVTDKDNAFIELDICYFWFDDCCNRGFYNER